MATWHEHVPPAAVVVVLPSFTAAAHPPVDLPQPPRWEARTRRRLLVLVVIGALVLMSVSVPVWLGETPGLWFNLLFTVLPGLFGLGMISVAFDWHTTASAEEAARERWRSNPPVGPPIGGVVADRHVDIGSESGQVTTVALLVQVGGEQIPAAWRRRGTQTLLQPQVPVIGSPVRLWRSPGGAVLVEALDPSAIPFPVQPNDQIGHDRPA